MKLGNPALTQLVGRALGRLSAMKVDVRGLAERCLRLVGKAAPQDDPPSGEGTARKGLAGRVALAAGIALIALIIGVVVVDQLRQKKAADPPQARQPVSKLHSRGPSLEQRLPYELDLDAFHAGSTLVIYTYSSSQDEMARSAAKSRTAGAQIVIVSFQRLASVLHEGFNAEGLDVSVSVSTDGSRALRLGGTIPEVLAPWYRSLVMRLQRELAARPALQKVQVDDLVQLDGQMRLVATYVGKPAPVAVMTDGAHHIGDLMFGYFRIQSITRDGITLEPANKAEFAYARVSIPIDGAAVLEIVHPGRQEELFHVDKAIVQISNSSGSNGRENTHRNSDDSGVGHHQPQ